MDKCCLLMHPCDKTILFDAKDFFQDCSVPLKKKGPPK